jgi:hypothetical protein
MADTTVKFLHSAMTGAPVLSGSAGALLAVLDACLINGFGSGSVDSLVIAGGVATVTRSAGHPMEVGAVSLIAGATVSGGSVNGEQKVLSVTTTTYTFAATGLADQTATGSITHKLAAAGWSKPFSSTNLAAYKSSDGSATGAVLRLDDSGTTVARVTGFESMSDINTGIGAFPTASQVSGGGYWPKSATADATARPWIFFGDGKLFYLAVQYTASSTANALTAAFGDPLPVKSPDAYCALLSCAEASPVGTAAGSRNASELDYGDAGSTPGTLFMPRSYAALGSAVSLRKAFPMIAGSGGQRSGNIGSGLPYPNYADGGLYVGEHYLLESPSLVLRAKTPGLYMSLQTIGSGVFANRDSVTSVVGLSGRTLKALNTSGVLFVDTTGPWR